jgi:hypothetical protein
MVPIKSPTVLKYTQVQLSVGSMIYPMYCIHEGLFDRSVREGKMPTHFLTHSLMFQTLHSPRMRRHPDQPNAAQPSERIPSTLQSTPLRARRPSTLLHLFMLSRQ